MLQDFISLIFPRTCLTCQLPLQKHEENICLECRFHLPRTNYHLYSENPVSQLFWGKVNIERATSYYHFKKGGRVQRLIHQLKYRGKVGAGKTAGRFFGEELSREPWSEGIDLIVPVPLHPRKKKKRGYNQCDYIAEGMAQGLGIDWLPNGLKRVSANSSQTRKAQYDRWLNVENIFSLDDRSQLSGKHILLVDDVITTGSTLEASAHALLQESGVKVSIATLACTS